MFNLFNPPYSSGRVHVELPLFSYLKQQTQYEIKKLISYYQDADYRDIPSSRLSKLLLQLAPYMNLNPETLYGQVRSSATRLCFAHNLISPDTAGKLNITGEMYNRNIPELFISVEYPIDIKKCVATYQTLTPIRVISHDFSDFSYGFCNGKYTSAENGLAIFTIDLALLAIQFQQWYLQERHVKDRGYDLPVTHFIARYVWTNLTYSHIDNVLFNRLNNRLHNRPNANPRNQHPLYLVDYGSRFDGVFDQLIDKFKAQSTDWLGRLNNLPSMNYDSYYSAMLYPDTAPTRQIKWAMVLAKAKQLEFLLLTDRLNMNSRVNLSDRVNLKREIDFFYNDKSITTFVPESTLKRLAFINDELSTQQP